VLKTIKTFPPVVFVGEARHLEDRLAVAAMGRAFVLQSGDCAETFKEFNANNIRHAFRILLQMGAILMFANQFTALPHQAPTRLGLHRSCRVSGVAPPSAYPSPTLCTNISRARGRCRGKKGGSSQRRRRLSPPSEAIESSLPSEAIELFLFILPRRDLAWIAC
jgi:hypothetical protein